MHDVGVRLVLWPFEACCAQTILPAKVVMSMDTAVKKNSTLVDAAHVVRVLPCLLASAEGTPCVESIKVFLGIDTDFPH